MKTSLTKLELHNTSVGGYFYDAWFSGWGRRSFYNTSLEKQAQKWHTSIKKAGMDMKSMEGFDFGWFESLLNERSETHTATWEGNMLYAHHLQAWRHIHGALI